MNNKKRTKGKPGKKTMPKKNKTTTQKASEAKPAKAKSGPETMDRATLKGIAGQLKQAGSPLKVLKSDSDTDLQKKVNDALKNLPSAEVVKKIESIDPNKLVNVLKKSCVGIFVDFEDASCVRCADAVSCVAAFTKNLKNGMADVRGAISDAPVDAEPKTVAAKLAPVTRYDASRSIWIRDVKNPNPKGDDYHDTIARVLSEQPETLGELRKIVELDFDLDGDGDFMKFVTALRDFKEGVIKLAEDLSDEDKAALKKAGYEI